MMNRMRSFRTYGAIFRMRRRMETQYRGAVLGGVICQVFFGLVLIAVYRALYAGNPQHMALSAITTYVWLQQAFFRMLLASDPDLMEKIRTGAIAYDLCWPLSLYGYYYARILAQKWMGSLLRALPMILLAILLPPGWELAAPASWAAMGCAAAALLIGLCCVSAMENITMAFTMRTLDPRGVQAMMNLLMMTFSGNILPLTLFPDRWQRVITLMPYAQLLDAPIRLYTGEYALGEAGRILAIQAGWTVILIGIGAYLWRRNQRRLIIQGG